MNLRIKRESLLVEPCLACDRKPHPQGTDLWCAVLNDREEHIFNLCRDCATTLARAYLKQLGQQMSGSNHPPEAGLLRRKSRPAPVIEYRRRGAGQ